MLIKEDLLKKIIELKMEEQRINEDQAARRARQDRRRERRAERRTDRDADRFEKDDPGKKLKDVIEDDLASTSDSTYEYVLSEVDRIMPMIEEIEQKHRGVRVFRALQSRREKRFTIGQVKRFIKTGLAYTKTEEYLQAADEFCAAGAFLESPKSPEKKAINIDREIIDTLYDLCEGLGKGGKFGKGKKKTPGGGGSTKPPSGVIPAIQETLNACAPERKPPLEIDGKWGDKTTGHYRAVVQAKLRPGMTVNGVSVTQAIIDKVLVDWPAGGPMLNYTGDPAGCLEFLKAICTKKDDGDDDDDDGGGSVKPPTPTSFKDCGWASRRTSFTKAEIPVGELLDISTGGTGLDINLVYDMKEFRKYYPNETFDDFTQMGHYYDIDDVKGFKMQFVERHPKGPKFHDTDMLIPADDYYYDCETGELLFSTVTGDGVLNDVIVVGNKLFYTRYPETHIKMAQNLTERKSRTRKKTVSEADVREYIRSLLIRENVQDYDALLKGLDAGLETATQGINLAASGMSNEELKDVIRQTGTYLDNFQKGGKTIEGEIDGAALNKKLELATKFMTAGKNDQAVENFKAVLQMVKTAENFEGKGTTVVVFDSLINVLDSKKKTTAQDISKLAKATKGAKQDKGAGSSGKGKGKKKGNSKVKEIQKQLNILNNNKPKLEIDGVWGSKTTEAWQKTLDSNAGMLEELSKEKFALADIKKKWGELSKILSATDKKFAGNIDGVLDLLQTLREQESSTDDPNPKPNQGITQGGKTANQQSSSMNQNMAKVDAKMGALNERYRKY